MKSKAITQAVVRKHVVNVLRAYGMGDQARQFKNICHLLSRPGKDGPFITFVGIDLQKGKEPAFKIYINPNI